jgi:hypothetical protein
MRSSIEARPIRRAVSVLVSVAMLAAGVTASATPRQKQSVSPDAPAPAPQPAPEALAQATPAPAYPPAYPPPAYPPPAYPPPTYAPPPPVYVPPGPSVYHPVGPKRMAYEDGQAVPPGYRVEQRVRQGPVIAGALLLGIPYVIGLTAASIANYEGQSKWLAVPVAGPWIMMYERRRPDCTSSTSSTCDVDAGLDGFLRFYLAVDGILQATGIGLLSFGLAGRKLIIRDDVAFVVRPMPIGSHGYGPAVLGRF